MKRMAMVILGTAFLLGACGEEEAQTEPEKVETTVQEQDDKQEKAEQSEPETKELTAEEKVQKAIKATDVDVTTVNGQFIQAPYTVSVEVKGSESMTNKMTVKGFKLDMKSVLYGIKESGVPVEEIGNVAIAVKYPLVDTHGNSAEEYVIKSDFSGETIEKLAEDEAAFDFNNVQEIADSWWEHPAIQ